MSQERLREVAAFLFAMHGAKQSPDLLEISGQETAKPRQRLKDKPKSVQLFGACQCANRQRGIVAAKSSPSHFFHPDCTVGPGVSPDHALPKFAQRSWALPPIKEFHLAPKIYSIVR
jgi:hypothetical protein